MTAQTFEVELDHGTIRSVNGRELPTRGRALLTIVGAGPTTLELADDLDKFKKLSTEEAESFLKDLQDIRANQPPLKSAWD